MLVSILYLHSILGIEEIVVSYVNHNKTNSKVVHIILEGLKTGDG